MRQKEGFKGQRTIVIPDYIIQEVKKESFSQLLFITDIGYYPHAENHYRTRPEGCNQYILMYCVDGCGWISVNSKKYNVKANQYFIIPANTPHAYASNFDDPWSIYWVHYSGIQASFFSKDSSSVQNITPSNVDRIDDRIKLFEEILLNLEMGYSLDNLNYANICLSHFLASFCYLTQFRQIRSTNEPVMIDRSILFMKNNLDKKLTLADLARKAQLSASHYSMVFKKNTGRAPLDYLIQLKIQKACQLLDHTSLRVKEVALNIGYDDPYYFSRIFKKLMGVSPKEYKADDKG